MDNIKFYMTDTETKTANDWMDSQRKKIPDTMENMGVTGGRFSFTVTPNSIAQNWAVTDGLSGDKEDVTDYSCW